MGGGILSSYQAKLQKTNNNYAVVNTVNYIQFVQKIEFSGVEDKDSLGFL